MKKTVFVVGAGASKEFRMPLGSELVRQIQDQMTREAVAGAGPIMGSAMSGGEPGDYGAAARDIAGGMNAALSIDRFLDSRKDRPLVVSLGKRAIAAQIALAEQRWLDSRDLSQWGQAQEAVGSSSSTWLAKLFALMQAGTTPENAGSVFERAAFITFNYDRVIEMYLRLAFRIILDQDSAAADAIVEAIPIHHIYGSLGSLPIASATGVPFGLSPYEHLDVLTNLSAGIRTFTEQIDTAVLNRAQELIAQADRIVFLGFAFDPVNVNALFPQPLREDQDYAGTAIDVPPLSQQNITGKIGRAKRLDLSSVHASALMDQWHFREFVEL